MASFEINDVFTPTGLLKNIDSSVRILETLGFDKIVIIDVDAHHIRAPKWIAYDEWANLLATEQVIKAPDPYGLLTSQPGPLPPAARQRLKKVIEITEKLSQLEIFSTPRAMRHAIATTAKDLKLSKKTIERWIYAWLKSGRNCAVVVNKFSKIKEKNLCRSQLSGRKRGVRSLYADKSTEVPASEINSTITKAYESFIKTGNMTWKSAYNEMLVTQFGIPSELFSRENNNILMDPAVVAKYRLPTWDQFRYRCRQVKMRNVSEVNELPRGERGIVSETVPGPGFFEIDATYFQIQLVSRITKGLLVGRPVVYLIVDLYDGIITGYSVTLENPSWATAALALHNCFSSKQPIFERLGLPYTEDDWPCHHLPNMLRADRAELVSNMGQHFNRSGIRVEVTPSMTPIAKGTVEGKHAHVKSKKNGRFNLPGRYSKYLKRRQSDGKKEAALDILEFEKILVEIIMDLNRSTVRPKQIPPDAVAFGSAVATRRGLHAWALEHRPGFTRNMPPNFVYEYLLTQAQGTVITLGILCLGEMYNSDGLREMGFLTRAIMGSYKITVSYNPLFAAELFYFNPEDSRWHPAFNTDPEVYRIKASFSEVKEFRALQRRLIKQAELDGHIIRQSRSKYVRNTIKNAVKTRILDRTSAPSSQHNIIANRAEEKAILRAQGMNGAISYNIEKMVSGKYESGDVKITPLGEDLAALWEKVDAISRS